MKLRLPLAALVALVLGFGLFAQDTTKPPEPSPRGYLRPNWKKLGLTDEQVKKVYQVQTDYRNKIDVLEAQIKSLQSEQFKKEVEVLTAAQKDRLKELGEFKDPTTPAPIEPPKKP
jgi:Spy/CpxP family protein refolding chaperone